MRNDQDFPRNVYRYRDTPDGTAEELICLVDPFCYISHLSALQYLGLTDRRPSAAHISTHPPAFWKEHAQKKMQNDFSEIEPDKVPRNNPIPLQQYRLPPSLRGRNLQVHQTKYLGEYTNLRSPLARISSIPQTLIDTLIAPQLCGGMYHVLEIWQQYGKDHVNDTVSLLDGVPNKIAKVRAGYIIEEFLNLRHQTVNSWIQFAQRGGSRKLDPEKPFADSWSERWMISLNA